MLKYVKTMYDNPFKPIEDKTLKELIKEKKLTQRQLAKLSGIPEVTIHSWVSGNKMPSFDNAVILASSLEIDLKTLAKSLGINVDKLPG